MRPDGLEGSLCVLAVDDNRDAADSLCVLLSLWGHRPLVAYDGATALALASRERPDIILLDMRLPDIGGWELARLLRAESGLEGVAIVAVTGFGQERDIQKSLAAGIDRHLLKPVEPDGRALATWDRGLDVTVWDAVTGRERRRIRLPREEPHAVGTVAL